MILRRFLSTSTSSVNSVFIVSTARTPIGSFQGALASLSGPQLGAIAVKEAVSRAGITPDSIDAAYLGNVLPAGAGQAPDRQAVLGAGLPIAVPCTMINKVCSSGLKAVMLAAQNLALGRDASVMVAGGFESMTQTPFMLPRAAMPYGGVRIRDHLADDGLTDPYGGQHMGACTENVVKRLAIGREAQDAYATDSYERAAAAYEAGRFTDELVAVEVKDRRGKVVQTVVKDEEVDRFKPGVFAGMRPAFDRDAGTITPGNASVLSDGAAALILMTEEAMRKHNVEPLARIVDFTDGACAPADFALAPQIANDRLLARNPAAETPIDLWEINEAFSAVVLANIQLSQLDVATVNVDGGAVSLGHPLGASGARILIHLVHALRQRGLTRGVASICNGGGGASAMMIDVKF